MNPRLPLVVILGATGSGKTKLSLELAKKFAGEVIGADSMQVYKGLNIITAKATKEEQLVAPHHLIDILDPHEVCTVVEYKNKALGIIENLLSNNKLPVVVGGTNYYIESLLWKILIDDSEYSNPKQLLNNDHELPSDELHKKLKQLDPVMAKRLHPNNKRKILRSLEILSKKGKKHSELLEEQQSAQDASKSGGGLRFSNSLVLWLQCDQEILDKRLDNRVDSMLEQGLLTELLEFYKTYIERGLPTTNGDIDYTKGILQSIGFKEFHSYLILNKEEQKSEEGQKRLNEGIEQLKMVTRRYARKQKRWILNRFLGREDRQVPPIYGLDTSNVSQWEDNVSKIAEQIVESYINKTVCPHQPLPKQNTKSTANSEDTTYNCQVCERVFVGNFQWSIHLKSIKHRKRLESRHKKDKMCTAVQDS